MRRMVWVVALAALPWAASEAQQPGRGVEPRARELLQRMSNELGRTPSFRVDTVAVDEVVLRSGQKLQRVSQSRVAVRRPDRLRDDRIGPFGDVAVQYDGRQLSIYGKRTMLYATAPMPPTLDAMIDVARDRYGLDAPGADLLYGNPFAVLMEDTRSGEYVGLEPIDGVPCHHLAFRGTQADWQIWIEDGPHPLPRRYVITSKNVPGEPEFAVQLRRWEPGVSLPDSLFTFTPPPGARRIELLRRGEAPSR